jgi:hypothetical protein
MTHPKRRKHFRFESRRRISRFRDRFGFVLRNNETGHRLHLSCVLAMAAREVSLCNTRQMCRSWITLAAIGLSACSKHEAPSETSTKPQPLPSAPSTQPAAPWTVAVDLLHESDITLRASEAGVDYFPDYLVDGREETAWHPAMVRPSATVDIQMPTGAVAKNLSIKVMAPKSKPKGSCDLRQYQDEQEQAHATLTFDKNATVAWPVNAGTRRVRLEFRGKSCAHLRVTELSLDGTMPAAQRLAWGVPEVLLGERQPDFRFEPKSLAALWLRGQFESMSALCKAQMQLTATAAAKADPSQPAQPSSYCTPKAVLAPTKPLSEPFLKVHDVEVGEESANSPHLLVVETPRGFYPANVALAAGTYDDRAATAYSQRVTGLETRDARLWLTLTRRRADFLGYPGVEPFDDVAEFTFVCSLNERLDCHRAITAYGETGPSWSRAVWMQETPVPPFSPKTWNWRRKTGVAPSGGLRFEACLDAQERNVPCHTQNLKHLLTE